MSQATKNECVFKCKSAKQLFAFPSEDILRNIWMYKLGLENYDDSFRLCDRHFSESQLSASGKKLVDLAVPDTNLPETYAPKKPIYDKLINKLKPKTATARKKLLKTSKPNERKIDNLSKSVSTKGWLNDSSTLLMDYQLRIQGKHVCDVVELPEYVVVLTVAIQKSAQGQYDTLPISTNDKEDSPLKVGIAENHRYIHAPTENSEFDRETYSQPNGQQDLTPEVDYVYYMTEDAIPRRDRQIQVDMPIEKHKNDSAIQCCIDLDIDMDRMAHPADYQVRPKFHSMQIEMHECEVCGDIMESYDSLVRHAIGHEDATSLCSRCGDVFPNRLQLLTHERDYHLHTNLHMQKALRCPKLNCKKAFYSRKRLNNHIEDHVRHVEHKCNRCLRLFPSFLRLLSHQKIFKNCWKLRCVKGFKINSNGRDNRIEYNK